MLIYHYAYYQYPLNTTLAMRVRLNTSCRSAPYHPSTNGEAEQFVHTFKNAMKAAKNDTSSLDTKLARFLIVYHSTPNTVTGESPAELLLHRRSHTRLIATC